MILVLFGVLCDVDFLFLLTRAPSTGSGLLLTFGWFEGYFYTFLEGIWSPRVRMMFDFGP